MAAAWVSRKRGNYAGLSRMHKSSISKDVGGEIQVYVVDVMGKYMCTAKHRNCV